MEKSITLYGICYSAGGQERRDPTTGEVKISSPCLSGRTSRNNGGEVYQLYHQPAVELARELEAAGFQFTALDFVRVIGADERGDALRLTPVPGKEVVSTVLSGVKQDGSEYRYNLIEHANVLEYEVAAFETHTATLRLRDGSTREVTA